MDYLSLFLFITTIYFFRRFRYYKKKYQNSDNSSLANILCSNKKDNNYV